VNISTELQFSRLQVSDETFNANHNPFRPGNISMLHLSVSSRGNAAAICHVSFISPPIRLSTPTISNWNTKRDKVSEFVYQEKAQVADFSKSGHGNQNIFIGVQMKISPLATIPTNILNGTSMPLKFYMDPYFSGIMYYSSTYQFTYKIDILLWN
jgi:hypothetical protein